MTEAKNTADVVKTTTTDNESACTNACTNRLLEWLAACPVELDEWTSKQIQDLIASRL